MILKKLALAMVLLAAIGAGIWAAIHFFNARQSSRNPVTSPSDDAWFEDVADRAGVTFRHFDSATPLHLIPETIGSGIAWIDFDGDGWPDLFCVQAGPLPPASPSPSHTHKLYRNNRNGAFTDVTAAVGLSASGVGCGCAVGDYDNDGFDDLVVTYLGGISLFHNETDPSAPGGRRFRDVTKESGLTNLKWGTSAAWADLDGDGLLDLYVCNYVEIDPANPVACKHEVKQKYFACAPNAFPHTTHRLFHNTGNGKFADVTASSGVGAARPAAGLGVLIQDLDGDGRADIYVANDMDQAYLFRNLGGMKFREEALWAGVALGPNAGRMAGMGVEAGDFDGSGRPSLFVTNFQGLPNAFFLNRGGMRFDDASLRSGLGGPSLDRLGFGTCILDVDLDGNPDLAVANGHVNRAAQELFGAPYAQAAQLFLGDGAGKFRDASESAGQDFVRPRVGRGLARADFDNDGRSDLAMSTVGEPVALFHNRMTSSHGWVGLELIGDGKRSNRNAIGAVVKIEWAGKVRHHFVVGGGSYLSASERRLHIGLGDSNQIDRVTVRWPSGTVQEFKDLPARTRWRLREGQPKAEPFQPSSL